MASPPPSLACGRFRLDYSNYCIRPSPFGWSRKVSSTIAPSNMLPRLVVTWTRLYLMYKTKNEQPIYYIACPSCQETDGLEQFRAHQLRQQMVTALYPPWKLAEK